jgi:hypothetical protein
VTAAIVTVGVLLVGFPLLAWWVGGRRFWNRAYGTETGELYRRMVHTHGLRHGEIAQVEGALAWGRELQDERLRAAVVDWAQELQRLAAERRDRHPTRRRILLCLLLVCGTGVLVLAAVDTAHGHLGSLIRLVLYAVLFGLPAWLSARAPRRAIERNSGRPSVRGQSSRTW